MDWLIDRDWRGDPAAPSDRVRVSLGRSGTSAAADLLIEIEAPYHADPAPPGPPGATPELWTFEVVELFLLGAEAHYLELEFGPHGHWLALELHGERNLVHSEASTEAVRFAAERDAARWRGSARIASRLLPRGLCAANAYAIHGQGAERVYRAHAAVPGEAPDFHRLAAFPPFDLDALPIRRSP